MDITIVKALILGKWKAIETPGMIIEFKKDNRVDTSINPHPSGGYIYSLVLSEYNLWQLSAPNIGFYFCFITELTESKMTIAKISPKQREELNISPKGKILSEHDIYNFIRE